ncbi:MAG: aspartate 1-decarboxylase [Bacillota bacterium]|nr:aspartate 1-decarboxylase [Bacillota bacterium]
MYLNMLKSKIHRARVMDANLNYIGSVTIDLDLMEASGIIEGELVHVVDINNGNRFETYAITGERGSKVICLNGAAARMVQKDDLVIIMAYAMMTPEEARAYKPNIVVVDENNNMTTLAEGEEANHVFKV